MIKNKILILALCLVALCNIVKAQNNIVLKIANKAKPTDSHEYALSGVNYRIEFTEDMNVAIDSNYFTKDIAMASLAFKKPIDAFLIQLMSMRTNLFLGTITYTDEISKEITVYEFDDARIHNISNSYDANDRYNNSNCQFEFVFGKLKINGIEIELIKDITKSKN